MIYAHFFVAKMIWAHLFCCKNNLHTLFCHKNYLCTFLSQKEFTHTFFVAKTIFAFFLSRKRFTYFVWKVFARWKLPSGKFRLFRPLAEGDLSEGPEGSQTSHLGPNWASLPTLNSTAIPINLLTIFRILNGNISNCRFHHDPLRKFMAQRDSSRRKTASYSEEGDLEDWGTNQGVCWCDPKNVRDE